VKVVFRQALANRVISPKLDGSQTHFAVVGERSHGWKENNTAARRWT
jgi:hypothetical protein